jgi:hypothetical protein
MAEKKGWKKREQHHLTAHERQEMPKSDFALPGKGEGPKGTGSGSYPIPDASHARNALSRVSANGTPEEKAEVRRKVHEKFPGIGDKKKRAESIYDHPRSRKAREAHGA